MEAAGPSHEVFSMPQMGGLIPEVAPIMKPDIVFFGEDLGDEFHNAVADDKDQVDLLIMIGSSLKVKYLVDFALINSTSILYEPVLKIWQKFEIP